MFDIDGTLFQTNKVLEASLEKTFELLRKEGEWNEATPLEMYKEIMGVPLPVVWETLLAGKAQAIHKKADTLFLSFIIEEIRSGNGELYPGAVELLKSLKAKNIPVFIASNGLEAYLKEIVDYFQLEKYLKDVYSIQRSITNSKVDLVQLLLKEYGIKSGVVIGDRASDIEAATNNDLLSIGCTFGFGNETELEGANYLINELNEVNGILDGVIHRSYVK
ncbi:hypothetical protein BFG57_13225 [Bacillus solimangrovi]|uniref:Nucleosidase n=1 Tax=Bacillus solimangrovi TaxID=1305675 RepID=A0A1E5LGE0_9BACI|nr:hypothetical protein BFG57_13225 [Bacillus solimangrovi]